MRRVLLAAAAIAAVFALTGCGADASDPKVMRQIAEARDTCTELGGTFQQWNGGFSEQFRCDFDETEAQK